MNTSNGGLIVRHQDMLIVSDLENYQGTFVLGENDAILKKIAGLMWFGISYGQHIFYSNQKDYDYLYCFDLEVFNEKCLLKKPVSHITLFEEKLLFLDESDRRIYKFDINTGKAVSLLKEQIFSFVVHEGIIYAAYASGLLKYNLHSGKSSVLTDHIPYTLNAAAHSLFFADRSQDFFLSKLEPGDKEPLRINNIKTQSIVVKEPFIYTANLLDNHSIIRLDMDTSSGIRFCGDKADKLHIIGDDLYYLNQNDKNSWYKLSLAGGRSRRLLCE